MTNDPSLPHHLNNNKKIRIPTLLALFFIGIGLVFAVFAGARIYTQYMTAKISPMGVSQQTLSRAPSTFSHQKKVVYGFLPYWTIKTAQIPQTLTHVAYFSLTLGRNGSFLTKQDGELDLGWHTFSSTSLEGLRTLIKNQHQKLDVVITMMDADEISAFLSDARAQQTAITNIKTLIKTQPINGINIDIEYAGTVTPGLRKQFSSFMQSLSQELRRLDPTIDLSVDVFADAAIKERIWDIPALANSVNYIVVMAYDFFRSSSIQSGPVAPLFGSEKNRWDTDIAQNLKAYLDLVPPEKILLGIPFYGYEWQTTSSDPGALTYPKSGGLATYKRVRKLIDDLGLREQWDPDAFSPYLSYVENGKTQMIYYENSRSLSYKLDLVNQAEFGGIAIWALGYDGENPELWAVIQQKFK